MSEVTVKFELSDQDRGLLTEILQELKNARPNCERCVQQMGDAVQNCMANAHPVDAVPPATAEDVVPAEPVKRTRKKAEPATPAESTKEEPKPEAAPEKEYTSKDVHAAVVDLIQRGKRTEAKAIVNQYATSVTGIPADKLAEVMAKLKEVA